jgi:hypothetical protein
MIRISSPDIWQGKSTQEAFILLASVAIWDLRFNSSGEDVLVELLGLPPGLRS